MSADYKRTSSKGSAVNPFPYPGMNKLFAYSCPHRYDGHDARGAESHPIRIRYMQHQLQAITWIVSRLRQTNQDRPALGNETQIGVILADCPGLGKTATALALAQWVPQTKTREEGGGAILILAPASCVESVWWREWKKMYGTKAQ